MSELEYYFPSEAKILSGKSIWKPTGIQIFETSFVEKLVKKFASDFQLIFPDKSNVIGWEASYPNALNDWSKSKLDLGLDYDENTGLFKTVFEVKRWYGRNEPT